MPFGSLSDPSRLQLLEDGKPVPAQWLTRATWTPGVPTSIKWLGLDFLARYENGKPRDYRVKLLPSEATRPVGPAISAVETPEIITVDTGVIRFHVNRKRFNGIETAWLDINRDGKWTDEEKIIQAPQPATGKSSPGGSFERRQPADMAILSGFR